MPPDPMSAPASGPGARSCCAAAGLLLLIGCFASVGSVAQRSLPLASPHPPTPAALASAEAPVTGAPVLDSAVFVRAVLERNPGVEAARFSWRAALARVHQAGTLEDPMLDLSVAPLSVGSALTPFGFEASLSQRLPWFGKRALETAASAAEAEASASDYQAVKRELALSAVMLYQQYFIATRSLEINAAHVELMRAMSDAATAQLASGRASAQDALQAEAELAHMEHDGVVLAAQRDVTVARMNELLHRAPELPLPPPPRELPPPPEPDATPGSLQQLATGRLPEILASEQRARAQQTRAERAELEWYPDLTLSTSYSSMWDLPAQRWMVGLGLHLPIQTGARAGAAEEARALRAQYEQEAARLRASARTRVFVALEQLAESKHVLGLFETRLLPIAQRRIEAARAGFSAAQTPFLAVIDAERSLRGLELEYQKARAEQLWRRAELDRAVGRIPGLDGSEGSP
jgi:outer membrane protein, heavy metal efflux system